MVNCTGLSKRNASSTVLVRCVSGSAAEQVDGGLEPGDEQQRQCPHQLIVGELVVVGLLGQHRHQVVARATAPLGNEITEHAVDLDERAMRVVRFPQRPWSVERDDEVLTPSFEGREVGVGHTEEPSDHPHRERTGEGLDQVDIAARREGVDHLVRGAADQLLVRGDRLGSEAALHEAPEPGVVGGVHRDEPGVERIAGPDTQRRVEESLDGGP
jgi:hypothetical protein